MGRENYIRLPKPGTNPTGVEITRDALTRLVDDEGSSSIMIFWET